MGICGQLNERVFRGEDCSAAASPDHLLRKQALLAITLVGGKQGTTWGGSPRPEGPPRRRSLNHALAHEALQPSWTYRNPHYLKKERPRHPQLPRWRAIASVLADRAARLEPAPAQRDEAPSHLALGTGQQRFRVLPEPRTTLLPARIGNPPREQD